mmetsp:Transcript_727/g.1918  ORF Transcript_727/g.1918 Transcript_727/m.1918 type:complete len:272 (+) Transcript_727:848-1663(+)
MVLLRVRRAEGLRRGRCDRSCGGVILSQGCTHLGCRNFPDTVREVGQRLLCVGRHEPESHKALDAHASHSEEDVGQAHVQKARDGWRKAATRAEHKAFVCCSRKAEGRHPLQVGGPGRTRPLFTAAGENVVPVEGLGTGLIVEGPAIVVGVSKDDDLSRTSWLLTRWINEGCETAWVTLRDTLGETSDEVLWCVVLHAAASLRTVAHEVVAIGRFRPRHPTQSSRCRLLPIARKPGEGVTEIEFGNGATALHSQPRWAKEASPAVVLSFQE